MHLFYDAKHDFSVWLRTESDQANLIFCFTFSCNAERKEIVEMSKENLDNYTKITLGAGCFWCVEAIFESVKGVDEVINGYSGGHTSNPTYEASNTRKTGHAESVEVIYDPKIVSFSTLVDVYFGSQNPLQVNGQGHDNGSQYRSIIFYQNIN